MTLLLFISALDVNDFNLSCVCVCVFRAPGEDYAGQYAGVHDSQEVCTTSFSTSPPSQARGLGHSLLFAGSGFVRSIFIPVLYFTFPFLSVCSLSCCLFIVCLSVCVCARSQCVCTVSPSPSKLSKPLPLDSLPLPLAPGLVTHTVSLYCPLSVSVCVRTPRNCTEADSSDPSFVLVCVCVWSELPPFYHHAF